MLAIGALSAALLLGGTQKPVALICIFAVLIGALIGQSDHGVNKSLYARDPDGLEFEVMYLVPADEWGAEEPRYRAETCSNGTIAPATSPAARECSNSARGVSSALESSRRTPSSGP